MITENLNRETKQQIHRENSTKTTTKMEEKERGERSLDVVGVFVDPDIYKAKNIKNEKTERKV